jgi:hypothetical protein
MDSLRRMAAKVDAQNAGDPAYVPLVGNEDAPAFRAALDLVFKGVEPAQRLYRAAAARVAAGEEGLNYPSPMRGGGHAKHGGGRPAGSPVLSMYCTPPHSAEGHPTALGEELGG